MHPARVPALPTRNKKLKVAFHFLRTGQTGWKCDECRRSGLEKQRGCGWLDGPKAEATRPVWARNELVLFECPRSYVSSESEALVESYAVWKRLGGRPAEQREAREVEAFLVLETELGKDTKRDARANSRSLEGRGDSR